MSSTDLILLKSSCSTADGPAAWAGFVTYAPEA